MKHNEKCFNWENLYLPSNVPNVTKIDIHSNKSSQGRHENSKMEAMIRDKVKNYYLARECDIEMDYVSNYIFKVKIEA